MSLLVLLLVIVLVVAVLGAPGVGPVNHPYGWYPSGVGGIIVLVLIILLLTGRL